MAVIRASILVILTVFCFLFTGCPEPPPPAPETPAPERLTGPFCYEVLVLPPLPGHTVSTANAINNADPPIVVGDSRSGSDDRTGIKWTIDEHGVTRERLHPTYQWRISEALDVNDEGHACGYSRNVYPGGRKKAVLWRDGTVEEIETIAGTSLRNYSWAVSISNGGVIAGNMVALSPSSWLVLRPFIFNGSQIVTFSSLFGNLPRVAFTAMDPDFPMVAGYAEEFLPATTGYHSNQLRRSLMMSDLAAGVTAIPPLVEHAHAQATDIVYDSEHQEVLVVGRSFVPPVGFHPFLWIGREFDEGTQQIVGETQDLKLIAEEPESGEAFGVNKNRMVVGTQGEVAFLWTAETGIMDLNTCVIPPSNTDICHIREATDINESGYICGTAYIDGQWVGVLLKPRPCASVVVKKWGPETVESEEVITYDFWVENLGDESVTLELRDPLPNLTELKPELNTEYDWQESNGQLSLEVTVDANSHKEIPLHLWVTGFAGRTITNTNFGYALEGFEIVTSDVVIRTRITSSSPTDIDFTPGSNCQEYEIGDDVKFELDPNLVPEQYDRVEYYVGLQKLGEVEGEPYEFVWGDAPAGVHAVRAIAYSGETTVFESEPVHLLVGMSGYPVVAYEVRELPCPPDHWDPIPYGMNDDGVVVGECTHETASTWTGTASAAVRWVDESPEILFEEKYAKALQVSNNGTIVGSLIPVNSRGEFYGCHPFILSPEGELTEIPHEMVMSSRLMSVNDRGQLAFQRSELVEQDSGIYRMYNGATIWQDGVRHDLVRSAYWEYDVAAVKITERGHVIGNWYMPYEMHPFIWVAPDDLSTLPEPSSVVPRNNLNEWYRVKGANDRGLILSSRFCPVLLRYDVDRPEAGVAVELLPGPPNILQSGAINDWGQIAASMEDGGAENRPYVRGCGRWIDLNSLIPENAGWELGRIIAINNDGTIIGRGVYHGNEAAYKLIPIR